MTFLCKICYYSLSKYTRKDALEEVSFIYILNDLLCTRIWISASMEMGIFFYIWNCVLNVLKESGVNPFIYLKTALFYGVLNTTEKCYLSRWNVTHEEPCQFIHSPKQKYSSSDVLIYYLCQYRADDNWGWKKIKKIKALAKNSWYDKLSTFGTFFALFSQIPTHFSILSFE